MVRMVGLLVGIMLLSAACGGPFARAVFVGVDYEAIDCDGGACVRVSSDVDGTAVGTGVCILYATTSEGQVAVAASGVLELNPGESFEWTVPGPAHLGSFGWNPICEPTLEG